MLKSEKNLGTNATKKQKSRISEENRCERRKRKSKIRTQRKKPEKRGRKSDKGPFAVLKKS